MGLFYILGDLFEVWLGDDARGSCVDTVSDALRDFTQSGSKLFLMHGNRDFLIGNNFAAQCGAQLIQEPYRLGTAHGDIILLHGDSLCTDDLEYQHFRNMVRTVQWQSEFLSRSLEERAQFAQQARAQSQESVANKTEEILDVNQQAVLDCFESNGCPRLLHGHTHRPAVHAVSLGTANRRRVGSHEDGAGRLGNFRLVRYRVGRYMGTQTLQHFFLNKIIPIRSRQGVILSPGREQDRNARDGLHLVKGGLHQSARRALPSRSERSQIIQKHQNYSDPWSGPALF